MTSSTPSSREPGSAGPLSGIRVLDLTWGMVGAVTTMLLADSGAEVIKVERPGGDPARRIGADRTWGRGKRSVVLDFAAPADVELLRELCRSADIVVDGLGAGRLERLGAGWDQVSSEHPGVIYCALSGAGPERDAPQLGFDILAAARFGVMAESPGHREGPIFPGHPAVAYGTALIATIGVLAALRARLVTGQGDRVDVSTRDGVLALMGMNWWSERQLSFIAARSRTGRLDLGRRRLLLERYVCADGVEVQVHTGAAGAFGRLMAALGIDERISRPAPGVETASELTDDDLRILREEVPALFRTRTSDEWMRHLWSHEVACLPVQPPGAVFDDDQVRHAGVIRAIPDDEYGTIEVVGPLVRLDGEQVDVVGPAPALDADGDAVRSTGWRTAGLGGRQGSATTLPHPLSGIRIVEFANWFASPYGNRLLRDLGADVVKVEPLGGDPIRPLPDPCEGANGGKRSVALDLKDPDGLAIVERLVRSADVIQHNMRPGAAERVGLGAEQLRSGNERLVYAYGPGYGSSGPKAQLQSFAPLISGFVGLMHLAAGDGNEPHTCFGNEDYYAGLLSAVGILTALVRRERTGLGGTVETPQLLAAVFVTSEHFLAGGQVHSVLPTLDRSQSGWEPTYRIYQCLTGWICLACVTDEQRAAVARLVAPDAERLGGDDLVEALQQAFFFRTSEEWARQLAAAGVPCEPVREDAWLGPFLSDDESVDEGIAVELEHPVHGRVRVIGDLVRLRCRPGRRRERSPLFGEHTVDVLEELGVDAERVSALEARGVVRSAAVVSTADVESSG